MSTDSTHRFSDRVDNYIRYRPGYPDEIYDFMEQEKLISKQAVIADIGSGTGISAEPLLKRDYRVIGIEPNTEMREAAERLLCNNYSQFMSENATAERTRLANQSVGAILAGQAFHWFDRSLVRTEFERILKPGGYVMLMWNDRRTNTSDFLRLYEDFLQMFSTDYQAIDHKQVQDAQIFDAFFGEGNYREKWVYNYQDLDFASLKGRVLSSSYMPNEAHEDYPHMLYCLKKIFMRYQQNGTVRLDYDTKLYYGKLN